MKWAGSKRWLAPQLEPLWRPRDAPHYAPHYAPHQGPDHAPRLVEPFCGSLAVAWGLQPRTALLSDANPYLIHFYHWLQRGLVIDLEMRNDRQLYARHRQRFNDLIRQGEGESREAAGLFYYLNRTGYNGLCRFNQRGEFNVPFGRYTTINYTTDFSAYQKPLAAWEFVCAPFERLALAPDDFIYADPPYDVEFRQYAPGGFAWPDQVRLAEWLAQHPGPVVLSNQATARIVRLYTGLGFDLRFLDGPRRISCTGDRTPAPEVLATRNCSLAVVDA